MDRFLVTSAGDEIALADPWPAVAAVTPLTVAWSLAQINRFTGHCIRPYSVAEHSLLVCELAERELHLDTLGQFCALLHDAHECIVGDQASPMKREIGPAWAAHEGRWAHAMRVSFGIVAEFDAFGQAVRRADLMALASERAALLPRTRTPWAVLTGIEPVSWAVHDLQQPERLHHDWEFWRDRWLDRFHELRFALDPAIHLDDIDD